MDDKLTLVTTKIIKLYTDGSCRGNPGPAGWGFLILEDDVCIKESFGSTLGEKDELIHCTNQQSEMTGALRGLELLIQNIKQNIIPRPEVIKLHSDSAYLLNCLKDKWYIKWRQRGWLTSKDEPVLNVWLWKRLIHCVESLQASNIKLEFIKVKAHQKPGTPRYDAWNERADELANQGTLLSVERMSNIN